MGPGRAGAYAIGFVALFGCQPQPGPIDAPPWCPTAIYDQPIDVAATRGTLPVGVRAAVRTTDGTGGVAIDIVDNKGTVDFGGGGPVPAFIYQLVPWPDIGYTLLSGMGLADGAWVPFWLYCTPDGTLDYLYAERTDRTTPFRKFVFGTCDMRAEAWDLPLDVPAHTLRNVALACGFTVATPAEDAPLVLEGSKPGVTTIDGQPATALVFAAVDCRTGCGEAPWFELHSLVWQPTTGRVGFAIWYLFGDATGRGVNANDVVTLPAPEWLQLPFPSATWTLNPSPS